MICTNCSCLVCVLFAVLDLLGLHVGMDVPVDYTPNYMYPGNAYLPLTTARSTYPLSAQPRSKYFLTGVDKMYSLC